MGRPTLSIEGWTPEQIKSLINNEDKFVIGLRLYAVYQVSLGRSSRELEQLYGVSFKQITNWVHRFEKEGAAGLANKPGRGRKPRLNETQLEALSDAIRNKSPLDFGYNTATWTGPLLTDWIGKEFGVEFKQAQIYNILKKLGFTHQKARGIYPEADPDQQAQFKEDLKKNS